MAHPQVSGGGEGMAVQRVAEEKENERKMNMCISVVYHVYHINICASYSDTRRRREENKTHDEN
jgi:hypothetical protein